MKQVIVLVLMVMSTGQNLKVGAQTGTLNATLSRISHI